MDRHPAQAIASTTRDPGQGGRGGGSLVYANTLYKAATRFFEDPLARGDDWESELEHRTNRRGGCSAW